MYKGLTITPPFFEIGPKAYLYGQDLLRLAQFADWITQKYGVKIIFTPQYVDIPLLATGTEKILVFAQHMDSLRVGRGVGSVLPEALKAAGAAGVMLNHAEKPLTLDEIAAAVARADEVGLATMVSAGTPEMLAQVARLEPNIVLAESPALIGTGQRTEDDQAIIAQANAIVWGIDPEIRVLHGAGISNGQDTGSTSGVLLASDPFQMLEEMVSSVRSAWDKIH
jgi:triosephosphate isomerase